MGLVQDEEAFLTRLSTFHPESWFAKPDALTPAVCASFGWKNIAPDRLQCETCEATLNYASSTDILMMDSPETVEAFLQSLEWEHDADCVWCENHCPPSFRQVSLDDATEVFQRLRLRFIRLSVIWDLPKLNLSAMCPADAAQFRALAMRLHQEWSQDLITSESVLDLTSEGWKARSGVLVVLALLGWDLRVMDHPFIYTQGEGSSFEIAHAETKLQPEASGYCIGRQSVLSCERCGAAVGLWSCHTHAEVAPDPFKEASKQRLQSGMHVVVDAESGEVEDLFQRPYPCTDVIEIAAGSAQSTPSQKRERPQAPRRTASLELEAVKRPVFGLQCLKKASLPVQPQQEVSHDASLEEPIQTGSVFDPIEEHRIFCCYRHQWREILQVALQSQTENV